MLTKLNGIVSYEVACRRRLSAFAAAVRVKLLDQGVQVRRGYRTAATAHGHLQLHAGICFTYYS